MAADKKAAPAAESSGSSYLFVWAGDEAHKDSDFLAVVDANPASKTYGSIVTTAPTHVAGSMPHHTEYEFPSDGKLFANGWAAGQSYVFDLTHPLMPRIAAQFTGAGGYSFPHSFARMPNGHILATFQSHDEGYAPGGGLVELDESGKAVRSASAVDPSVSKDVIWPYSLAIAPKLGMVVTSSTPMGWPKWATAPAGSWDRQKIDDQVTAHVQLWRLSDLHLLHTIELPADAQAHNRWPAEPRLLPDGTVYVNTFTCGLFRMTGLQTEHPSAQMVFAFPGGDSMHTMCAVPVVVGHYWIQPAGAVPGLIVLDISDPAKPVEVSRLKLDSRFPMPHWLSVDRRSNRLVMTGDDQSWVLVAKFDPNSGTATIDESFHAPGATTPGISFDRRQWPHGKAGKALVHGALFGE